MVKRKTFEIQKWFWIAGIPAVIGVVLMGARTIVAYADMPKRVETIEKYVEQQQRANEIQAQANELMQQQLQKQDQVYCEVYEGILYCWDERTQQWYQPQGGQ